MCAQTAIGVEGESHEAVAALAKPGDLVTRVDRETIARERHRPARKGGEECARCDEVDGHVWNLESLEAHECVAEVEMDDAGAGRRRGRDAVDRNVAARDALGLPGGEVADDGHSGACVDDEVVRVRGRDGARCRVHGDGDEAMVTAEAGAVAEEVGELVVVWAAVHPLACEGVGDLVVVVAVSRVRAPHALLWLRARHRDRRHRGWARRARRRRRLLRVELRRQGGVEAVAERLGDAAQPAVAPGVLDGIASILGHAGDVGRELVALEPAVLRPADVAVRWRARNRARTAAPRRTVAAARLPTASASSAARRLWRCDERERRRRCDHERRGRSLLDRGGRGALDLRRRL